MKRLIKIVALASTLLVSVLATAGQQELVGVWQGKLAIDSKTSLTVQFTFGKDANGMYTATLESLENAAIKNTPASDVSFDGSIVKLKVSSLSGAYEGAFKDGKINGQWTQPGSTLPLVLSAYQKPVLSKAAIDTLIGPWNGPFKMAGTEMTFVAQFKVDEKGTLKCTVAVDGMPASAVTFSTIEFTDGKFVGKFPAAGIDYSATFTKGQLVGTWKQTGLPADGLPLTLMKGEYVAPVHALKLSTEEFKALAGNWQGKLELTTPQGQKVSLSLVVRFETNKEGQYVGFMDSPDQKALNIPVTEATLADGKVTVKVGSIAGEFTGTLSDKTLNGQWSQRGAGGPLVLTR